MLPRCSMGWDGRSCFSRNLGAESKLDPCDRLFKSQPIAQQTYRVPRTAYMYFLNCRIIITGRLHLSAIPTTSENKTLKRGRHPMVRVQLAFHVSLYPSATFLLYFSRPECPSRLSSANRPKLSSVTIIAFHMVLSPTTWGPSYPTTLRITTRSLDDSDFGSDLFQKLNLTTDEGRN